MLAAIAQKAFYITDNLFPKKPFHMCQVSTNLYRGGGISPEEYPIVAKQGIKKIICLQEIPDEYSSYCSQSAQKYGMNFTNRSLNPFNFGQTMKNLIQDLKDPDIKLVYCAKGEHRTGLGVALDKFLNEGIPMETALQELNGRIGTFYKLILSRAENYLRNFAKLSPNLRKINA